MINILCFLLISLIMQITLFTPAFIFKTDKLTDLSYSLTFLILTLIAFLLNNITSQKIILLSFIILWSLRLGIFLFIRINKNKKDKRFDNIRNNFFKFLIFWIIQGIIVWVLLIPSIFFLNNPTISNPVSIAGIFFFILGLIIETTADWQKFKFKSKKWISSGLWKYSRHPNYFGEILIWIGIYIFVFPSLTPTQKIISLASPILIYITLRYITGIPKLENYADKKWGKNKQYQKYKQQTNLLVPWFKSK